MARVYCPQCQRPTLACICQFAVTIVNQVAVVVLQHPTETAQSKGTASLLRLSLTNYQTMIGEDFTDNLALNNLIQQYGEHCYLLYPDDSASAVTTLSQQLQDNVQPLTQCCIILLDATWKKSYRMYQLSKNLQALKKLTLAADIQGQYLIRKTRKVGALSTLEACVYALQSLEKSPEKYQPLLNAFMQFNLFQLNFAANASKN